MDIKYLGKLYRPLFMKHTNSVTIEQKTVQNTEKINVNFEHDRINNLCWNLWLFSLIIDCTRAGSFNPVMYSLSLTPILLLSFFLSLSLTLTLSALILSKCHFNMPMILSKKYIGYSFFQTIIYGPRIYKDKLTPFLKIIGHPFTTIFFFWNYLIITRLIRI